ncbi:MAG: hypothetical protein HZB25_03695 [Candidatus Eisenbacteria bacterium]|nr:hypothetical protein [Candidatus Eisenbacteria bacterium]
MRSRTLLVLLGAAVLALALGGCIFFPDDDVIQPPAPKYLAPISPENVIKNLETLYISRDFTQYDSVLAAGYIFRFQPADITAGAPDSLIRVEEMNFAENLFQRGGPDGAPPASRIGLVITKTGSGPDPRFGHAGWLRYNVSTNLTITFSDGNAMAVVSPALFYFVQEPAGSGMWRLAEWADQPSGKPELLEVRREYTVR